MSRNLIGFIVGGIGVMAGCAIGLMVAPASGAEIRRRVAWRLDEERHALARNVRRLKAGVSTRCAEVRAGDSTAA